MIPISIEKFADITAKNNKDINREDLIKSLKATLEDKNNGSKCCQCVNPIWAAGSAITGIHMCFSCITLEADDSDDYEIE